MDTSEPSTESRTMIAISTPIRILPRRDIRMLGISGRMATEVLLIYSRPTGRPRRPDGCRALPCYSNVPIGTPVPGQWHDLAMTEHADTPDGHRPILLEAVAAEIEAFVGQAGWDQAPTLYALVPTRVLAADPA